MLKNREKKLRKGHKKPGKYLFKPGTFWHETKFTILIQNLKQTMSSIFTQCKCSAGGKGFRISSPNFWQSRIFVEGARILVRRAQDMSRGPGGGKRDEIKFRFYKEGKKPTHSQSRTHPTTLPTHLGTNKQTDSQIVVPIPFLPSHPPLHKLEKPLGGGEAER